MGDEVGERLFNFSERVISYIVRSAVLFVEFAFLLVSDMVENALLS